MKFCGTKLNSKLVHEVTIVVYFIYGTLFYYRFIDREKLKGNGWEFMVIRRYGVKGSEYRIGLHCCLISPAKSGLWLSFTQKNA